MVIGAALVLATWLICIAALVVVGLPFGLRRLDRLTTVRIRQSLWMGLLVITVMLLGMSLVRPLGSGPVLAAVSVGVLIMGAIATLMGLRFRGLADIRVGRAPRRFWLPILLVLIVVSAYLAVAALGPVTNYDTGLYHLGAIRYAADYATIPGLANLFNPFGYDNSQFVLGAFLGNGPWGGDGYRLLNGLFVILVLVDLCLRFLGNRRRPGDFVLLIGAGLALVPLVGMADYLVTSPTSDTAVMLLTLVSSAYLVDASTGVSRKAHDAGVALATAVMAFLMRPTMIVFVVLVLVALIILAVRRPLRSATALLPLAVVSVVGLGGLGLQVARDYLLSGWLFYPLSLHGFSVPWRTLDPAVNREMTLAVARNPVDYVDAAHGWAWVLPWFRRLPLQWESYEILVAIAITLACLWSARGGRGLRPRLMLFVMMPAAISVVFWWLATPPSFRFAWGPIFALAAIPSGWALWRAQSTALLRRMAPIVFACGFCILVAYCSLARLHPELCTARAVFDLGPFQVELPIAPVPIPPTIEKVLPTGVILRIPTETDQCWAAYPMCTYFTDTDISYRGQGIAEGFIP